MSNTNEQPVTLEGTRLDTLAYNIETMTGRHNLAQTRNQDTPVPGRNGVLASLYDDYDAGQVYLQMWVRSRDVDGNLPDGETPKQRLQYNLDRIYALARSRHRLLDLRDQVGPDAQNRQHTGTNPRLEISTPTTSVIRSNYVVNPSFERSTTTVTLRTNRVNNPSFEVDTGHWTTNGTTLGRVSTGAVGNWHGVMTCSPSASANEILSDPVPIGPGIPHSASAQVSALQVNADVTIRLGLRWFDGSSAEIQTDWGAAVHADPSLKFTTYIPNWTQVEAQATAPASTASVKVVVAVAGPLPRPGFETYAVDAVLLERSATIGDYFDGDSTDIGGAWAGTAHASNSNITMPGVSDWQTPLTAIAYQNTEDAAVSTACAVWHSTGAVLQSGTDPDVPVLWHSVLPAQSASASWSAGIYAKCDMDDPPELRLRISSCNSGGTRQDWFRFDSTSGDVAETVFTPTSTWKRYRLENALVPVTATGVNARLEVISSGNLDEGVEVMFDAADLQSLSLNPSYFDGDRGANYFWASTANNSVSQLKAGTVDNWTATRGSLTVTHSPTKHPLPGGVGCGLYTHTTSGQPEMFSSNQVPETLPRTYTGGAYVWGAAPIAAARVVLQSISGASTVIAEAVGDLVDVSAGWTWVPGPNLFAQAPATSVRVMIRFYTAAGAAPASTGGTARVTGAIASTGSLTGFRYYDKDTHGGYISGAVTKHAADIRQAMVKTVAGVVPEVTVNQMGHLTARLRLEFEIPSSFWQDVSDSVWQSPTISNTTTRIFEVSPLRGATAPIEDAIILVYGPTPGPVKLTDPVSGGWIQLNTNIASGAAWMIDVGRGRSVRGSATLAPTSSSWADMQKVTDYVSPRAGMFLLHPDWSDTEDDHLVRIQLSGGAGVKVTARRKYLG